MEQQPTSTTFMPRRPKIWPNISAIGLISESTGGVSKVIVVCSPTRVHIVDYITSSSIPVSPTRSSLTTQNNLREVPAQFKTLHFESEVVFVGAGIGVATVACHNGQVRVYMRGGWYWRGVVFPIF